MRFVLVKIVEENLVCIYYTSIFNMYYRTILYYYAMLCYYAMPLCYALLCYCTTMCYIEVCRSLISGYRYITQLYKDQWIKDILIANGRRLRINYVSTWFGKQNDANNDATRSCKNQKEAA